MYKDLLAQTTLIALPLMALFIFLGVFFFVIVQAMMRAKSDIAEHALLPLESEERHGR